MMKPAELYACLYVKEFPAQALLRLRPELRDNPCVVMEGEPPLQRVCSLNAKARTLGVAPGMTRVEVDTFPSAIVLARSEKEEAAAKAVLLECASAFSPRMEDRSEDGEILCVIDIAGTEKLLGPPEVLARNLLNQVKALGITACAAVSINFHAAISLAKGMSPRTGVKVIPAGEEGAALAPLPLAVLDLAEGQAEVFSLWGIHTLEMLAALPEKELVARMGQEGTRLRRLARGELTHLFQPVEPVFSLEECMELDSPVELLDSLLFVAGVMLEQLILRAKARALALASVSITLTLEGGTTHVRTARPALPTNEKQIWIKLLHLDLEAHPPHAAVLSLALAAEPGSPSKVQMGLFSPQLPELARLDVTLARIRAIVGEEYVGRAVLKDTHAPDGFRLEPFRLEPFRMEPFSIPSEKSAVAAASWPRVCLRQLRPPETISITFQRERPKTFVFRERHYSVEHAYGPWLTGGDWWSGVLWGLEQWDLVARTQDGTILCCCMARNLMRDLWQMAALYD